MTILFWLTGLVFMCWNIWRAWWLGIYARAYRKRADEIAQECEAEIEKYRVESTVQSSVIVLGGDETIPYVVNIRMKYEDAERHEKDMKRIISEASKVIRHSVKALSDKEWLEWTGKAFEDEGKTND